MRSLPLTRRAFLRSSAFTGVTLALSSSSGNATQAHSPSGATAEAWLNPPKRWKLEESSLICSADPKTDFWRKTFYGYITDNGHFYYRRASGDFITTVKVSGKISRSVRSGWVDGTSRRRELDEMRHRIRGQPPEHEHRLHSRFLKLGHGSASRRNLEPLVEGGAQGARVGYISFSRRPQLRRVRCGISQRGEVRNGGTNVRRTGGQRV